MEPAVVFAAGEASSFARPRVHPRYYHFIVSVRLGVDGPRKTDL